MRGTSSIVSTTLVVAGPQIFEGLGINRVGEDDTVVSMLVGPVLYRIYKPELVVDHVYQMWRAAGVHRTRLPKLFGPVRLPGDGSQATCVLSLTAYPAVVADLVPGRTALDKPHLALRVGALHLVVKDLAAYESTLDAWRRARDLVRPEK
ncbi:hypothetical protein [Lentzea sp. NBRC 102530]|uniref:hypothetical protein n=1 Tax=Lentzea sp. NBRC 102530 TaxID=3032201 RepID=UPI0024A5E0E9|nr:hypothetical protein [Lentzea sp. NBRC 102530]GLY54864.1 hypothetical protein Lesp01_85190 [Lentzea sp. NBRC 102530]